MELTSVAANVDLGCFENPNGYSAQGASQSERFVRSRTDDWSLGLKSFLNEPYFGSSWSEAAKGLRPREHSIAKGVVLYRFVDSRRRTEDAADGPWWFEYEHFQTIRHFALQHDYSLSYAARLFAAILYEWSEVDTVIRARTKAPLKVWKGAGKQIESSRRDSRDVTERMTPMQGHNSVLQLYVPGLGRPHRKFPELMSLLEVQRIATTDSF